MYKTINFISRHNRSFKVDDIISYAELVAAENANVRKGMNFQIKPDYSIFLMSVRKNSPCSGKWDEKADIKEKIKNIYCLPTNKFKMKIRNIAGDEIMINYL